MRNALTPTSRTPLLAELAELARARLSADRFAHASRTAIVMRELCEERGLAGEAGEIAGLAHDLYRESSAQELAEVARRDVLPLEEWELREPIFLHGRAAAVLLRERFGLTDAAILEAVRWHTTGFPGMGELAKLLYIADYIEPGRAHVNEALRARVRSVTADEGVLIILKETAAYLHVVGKRPAAPSLSLYEELKGGRRE